MTFTKVYFYNFDIKYIIFHGVQVENRSKFGWLLWLNSFRESISLAGRSWVDRCRIGAIDAQLIRFDMLVSEKVVNPFSEMFVSKS